MRLQSSYKNIMDNLTFLGEERKIIQIASNSADETTVAMLGDYLKEQEELIWMLVAYNTGDCKK